MSVLGKKVPATEAEVVGPETLDNTTATNKDKEKTEKHPTPPFSNYWVDSIPSCYWPSMY